jgi:D-serine dehydratase
MPTISFKPFREMALLAKEKFDEKMLPITERKLIAQAEVLKINIESDLLSLEEDMHRAAAQSNIDWNSLLLKRKKVTQANNKLRRFEEILGELFPETYGPKTASSS